MDSAYQNTPSRHFKTFSSQNACTFLNKRLFLIFFLTTTTLFSIKINDIVNCLGNLTDCSLYVDDSCMYYRSKSMATIERQLQQNLNKIEN